MPRPILDYEKEVKKVYHDAELVILASNAFDGRDYFQVRTPFLKIFTKKLSRKSFHPDYAWQDAYEKL